MGRRDYVTAATAKVEIGGADNLRFFRRVLLLGGTEASKGGCIDGLYEKAREGGILLLPLKVAGFGGELVPRVSRAHTHARVHN